jgi:hypothetical protein
LQQVLSAIRAVLARQDAITGILEAAEHQVAVALTAAAAMAKADSDQAAIADALAEQKRLVRLQAKIAAVCGVGAIDLHEIDSKHVRVVVDRTHGFELPRAVAEVLEIVISAPGAASDGFAPWIEIPAIQARLEKKRGKRPSRHSVTQAIYCVRYLLKRKVGLPSRLIETCRRRGVRVRLRRWETGAVAAGDPSSPRVAGRCEA